MTECSGTVTDGVSQAGCVYPSATAQQTQSPKHSCEPGEIKAHIGNPPRSAVASRFSEHHPDLVVRASGLLILRDSTQL